MIPGKSKKVGPPHIGAENDFLENGKNDFYKQILELIRLNLKKGLFLSPRTLPLPSQRLKPTHWKPFVLDVCTKHLRKEPFCLRYKLCILTKAEETVKK